MAVLLLSDHASLHYLYFMEMDPNNPEDFYVPILADHQYPDAEPLPVIRDGVLKNLADHGNPLDKISAETVADLWIDRELASHNTAGLLDDCPVNVSQVVIPARNHQIPARIYSPRNPPAKPPLLVYLHGGGWALNSAATGDSVTRYLAWKVPAVVVSVDYRLTPEHPFPAAFDDAYLATQWAGRYAADLGTDPRRVGIAGDSAGATLATGVAMKLAALRKRKSQGGFPNEAGTKLSCQALIYPSTNLSSTDYPSYRRYGAGYWLTLRAMQSFRQMYLPNHAEWTNPFVAPLLANDDELESMPATLIVTAGCDPLRDEGELYAKRLHSLGVPVRCNRARYMPHAFLALFNNARYVDASAATQKVIDAIATDIAGMLGNE